jgi:hypothetical protein
MLAQQSIGSLCGYVPENAADAITVGKASVT